MSHSKGWDFEANSQEKAGELQLQAYGEFLNEYGSQIRRIELNLEDFINTSWNFHVDPITLTLEPYENTTILELISTDNKVLKKVLAVFTSLSEEVHFLQKEANEKFFNSLLFYGEAESTPQDENVQMNISSILPLLQELTTFIKRCQQVASQIILQLNALYSTTSEGTLKVINASDIHLYEIFESLGELMLILIILEEIIKNHHILQENWMTFKQTIKTIYHDTVKFGIEAKKLKLFEKKIMNIETILFSGKIFMSSINQILNQKVILNKNIMLADEFNLYLKNALINLENKLNDQINCDITHFWVKISGIFIVNSSLFGTSDKKIFKQIWDLHKKIPAVNLIGNILWFPEQFFNANMPQLLKLIDKKSQAALLSARKNYLKNKSQTLQKEVNQYTMQVFLWMIQLESSLQKDSTQLKLDILNTRCNLILQSANLASSIKYSIKTILNLYVALSMPMTKSVALAICRLVEILKSIYLMFSCHILSIAESINHVKQFLIFQALNIISKAKKGLIKDKHYSAKSLDILSALVLAEICLNGPGTRQRRLITILSISIANQMKTFKEDDLIQLFTIIKKLDIICEIQSKLSVSCNCSFLYWHRVIIPIYFTDLYESHTDVHRLMYMFCAFYDSLQVIIESKHSISPMKLKSSFENEILEYLKVCIIKPLCHKVETNLRLYAHSHLQMNEIKNAHHLGIEDYMPIIKLKPIKLGDNYINIKSYLEHYLDETFYNLITVALHDWRTYGEMRGLAKYKYDLITVEDHLPSQTLEQGLDVLEIMRNIHIFVSKYLYNLNNQIFIEQSSNNKHLNTINIQHIANSIRTHGTGIMNTTVNFTYQFLRKKFFVFSQFMYDEHIKSRLSKDLRYFRENKEKLEQKYPYERANKFNKGIRNLGLNSEGQSYLDQFRILITHIGNAMGYIRMIRSGGLHCCSNAICFIPDLDDIVNFEELCKEENLSKSCIEAAQTLDQIIQNLIRNFAEGTEYFKLLVDVFSPVFREKKNIHLRNFYVIVPALTINFVEYSTTCKEKLSKKNKIGAAFTDDGFAMGIAYILKLLDQYNEFDSLHWFQSIREKYMKEKQNLQEQKENSSKDDEKLQQTMTLTERRLDIFQQEFDLLYYNLSSARIFFQKDQSQPRIDQNKSDTSI